MKRYLWAMAVAMVLHLASTPVSAAPSPTDQVRATVDEIILLLNDENLSSEMRNQKIAELVKGRFDFATMSQWILGVHWRKATPAQRDRFVELFSQLLETTYRGRINDYSDEYTDEKVRYDRERLKGDKALVETRVITDTAEIPIHYKLVLNQGQWQAYDVVIEKVSLVRNYRSTYDEIVRNEGFAGLFRRMEQKIEELKTQPAAAQAQP